MVRVGLAAIAMFLLAATGARAEVLSGSEIRAAVTGAQFVGKTPLKSPYTITFRSNQRLSGVIGEKNQFRDIGRWWINDDDKLCMHWELWEMGKPTCYGIDLSGDQISRLNASGTVYRRSKLIR